VISVTRSVARFTIYLPAGLLPPFGVSVGSFGKSDCNKSGVIFNWPILSAFRASWSKAEEIIVPA
jgi:hypothetical protein